jgi:hypothetical protein
MCNCGSHECQINGCPIDEPTSVKSTISHPPDRRLESLMWLDRTIDEAIRVAKKVSHRCPDMHVDTLVIQHLTTASEAVALMVERERGEEL